MKNIFKIAFILCICSSSLSSCFIIRNASVIGNESDVSAFKDGIYDRESDVYENKLKTAGNTTSAKQFGNYLIDEYDYPYRQAPTYYVYPPFNGPYYGFHFDYYHGDLSFYPRYYGDIYFYPYYLERYYGINPWNIDYHSWRRDWYWWNYYRPHYFDRNSGKKIDNIVQHRPIYNSPTNRSLDFYGRRRGRLYNSGMGSRFSRRNRASYSGYGRSSNSSYTPGSKNNSSNSGSSSYSVPRTAYRVDRSTKQNSGEMKPMSSSYSKTTSSSSSGSSNSGSSYNNRRGGSSSRRR